MKKLLFLCIALSLVVLQFSSLGVSANDHNSSYKEQLAQQKKGLKENSKLASSLKLKSKFPQLTNGIKKQDTDYFYEIEPNDLPSQADTLPMDTMALGQFLTYDDLDFYKLNVPSTGNLVVGGVTDEYAYMDLVFGLVTSDGDIIEPDDYYYDGDVLLFSYNVRAGSYYVLAGEYYGLPVYDEYYGIIATFEGTDTTPPSKPVINVIDNNDTVISGKAEAGSYVYVYRGTTFLKSGVADSSGKFSLKIPMQQSGTTLSVFAEDAAGNTSAKATIKVLDKTPPPAPNVNPVDDNDTIVKGKTEANATVTVKKGSTVLGTTKATSKGDYYVKIKPVAAKSTIAVTSKDTSGNISKATTLIVKDKTPPKIIKVSPVDHNDLYVKGKSEPNATIIVKKGSTILGSAKANSKGDFSVKIKAQKAYTSLSVYAKDLIGNTSKATTVKVAKVK